MGDNIYLVDRNDVRTPMQWNGGWNGRCSSADPEQLYSPIISDPLYGYQTVNVESQKPSEHSLLAWMKQIVRVRKSSSVFSRGSIEFLTPASHRVSAYIRELWEEQILIVNNLSGSDQAAELDLRRFKRCILIEMLGGNIFPRMSDSPYFLTLGPDQFYWFR